MSSSETKPSLCLFGAPTDTGNLGVSALGLSVVSAVARRPEKPTLTVFDFGRGVREETITVDGEPFHYTRIGAMHTRRLHWPESLTRMRVTGLVGGLGNPGVRAIRKASAVLDISGGDSFTDLYGQWRFRSIVLPKQITLSLRTPLVLLPQTFGPFEDPTNRAFACRILERAQQVWTRDLRSYHLLQELLCEGFDYSKHRAGVDVAFALDVVPPEDAPPEPIAEWFDDADTPVAGVNVSGLLYHDPEAARERFGLKVNYRELMHRLVEQLTQQAGARVLLVPHVLKHEGNDVDACEAVKRELPEAIRDRVAVVRGVSDARLIKWYIGQCDWFTGARMHSTIAALSTGVPTAGMAYSLKMQGIFDLCDVGKQVVDLRTLDTDAALEALQASWQDRQAVEQSLQRAIGHVKHRAAKQLNVVLDRYLRSSSGDTAEASGDVPPTTHTTASDPAHRRGKGAA